MTSSPTSTSAVDLEADPGARAMWDYVQRQDALGPGEEVTASRFLIDRDDHQRPSPTLSVALAFSRQQVLGSSRLSWDLLSVHSEVDGLHEIIQYSGYHHAEEADYTVDGHRYVVFARDFRRGGAEEWLDLLAGHELDYAPSIPYPAPPDPVLPLSRHEFATAVRQALRDLHRPDVLARNPLAGCRIVREYGGTGTAEALAGLLHAAAGTLRADPRDDKFHRVIDRTYLRPALTQERAADVLGLPFSTYRRHLTTGLSRVVDLLWHWELHGVESRPPG